MSRKEITRSSAVPTDSEGPTAWAELAILLIDLTGRREPVRWQREPVSIARRWKHAVVRRINRPRPTEQAELAILLVDPAGRREPVNWRTSR